MSATRHHTKQWIAKSSTTVRKVRPWHFAPQLQRSPELSVIVVVHNAIELTRRCLTAMAEASISCDYELVLVDNGSSEAIDTLPAEFSPRIKKIRYLRHNENLSYSLANNIGAASAQGHHLLFLNNDVLLLPGSVERLLEEMDAVNNAAVAGGKLLYPDTHSIQHAGIKQMLWGYVSNYGVGGDSKDPRFNEPGEVFALTGAMLCVRRRLFNEVGGFSPCYQFGYEDVDLCLKLREAHRQVLYVPEASALHYESATLRTLRSPQAFNSNYAFYRSRWDKILIPEERRFAASLRRMGILRVVIFGTGRAAAGLFDALVQHGIQTVAFASLSPDRQAVYHGRPVIPLESLDGVDFDRLMAGSQYFFQYERMLSAHDPQEAALMPVILQPTKSTPEATMVVSPPMSGRKSFDRASQ